MHSQIFLFCMVKLLNFELFVCTVLMGCCCHKQPELVARSSRTRAVNNLSRLSRVYDSAFAIKQEYVKTMPALSSLEKEKE